MEKRCETSQEYLVLHINFPVCFSEIPLEAHQCLWAGWLLRGSPGTLRWLPAHRMWRTFSGTHQLLLGFVVLSPVSPCRHQVTHPEQWDEAQWGCPWWYCSCSALSIFCGLWMLRQLLSLLQQLFKSIICSYYSKFTKIMFISLS